MAGSTREAQEQSKRAIYRLGVSEDLSDVGLEKHYIGAGFVLFVVLAAHAA